MDRPEQTSPEDLIELPLFPLNLVLFPGMALPLHIFEERYKAMIGDCLERNEPFGVVLIKEGQEVGDPAEPFQVGTTARIVQVERLEGGRLNIMTRGERRFEVVEITQQLPHVAGRVRYLEEEAGEDLSEIVAETQEGYAAFLRTISSLAGGWAAQASVPREPVRLSYAVAASLTSSIELPQDIRQRLLETPTARERLDRLLPLLRRGNELLQQEVAKRNPFQGPRLN